MHTARKAQSLPGFFASKNDLKGDIPVNRCKTISGYLATAGVHARQVFDGSLYTLAGEYGVRFLQFWLLTLIWRSLAAGGADLGGMTLESLLTYTLMASILRQQLEIVSPLTSALWEGSIIGRYTRPLPIFGSFVAETVGRRWVPVFLLYSLPLWLIAPLWGVSPLPASLSAAGAFAVSLLLSISLGFALDFLFAAFALRMKNGCWAALMLRETLAQLLSGALIPFSLLPWGLGRFLSLLPFGSIASAPLSIYVAAAPARPPLLLQLFWNAVLWPLTLFVYRKNEEEMISFGG